jgi:hypothetical protein
MAADDNYRTVYRLVEYHGPVAWLEQTLAQSRVPIQGALNLPKGVYIKSGIIVWQPDAITEAQVSDNGQQSQPVEPPTVKTVPFKRPGE